MNEYQIIVSDDVSAGDLLVIENGLNRFNDQHTGVNDRMPLSVVIKDPATGETLGAFWVALLWGFCLSIWSISLQRCGESNWAVSFCAGLKTKGESEDACQRCCIR